MKAFLVKKGTEVAALTNDGKIETKVTNQDKMYFLEDIVVDPIKNVGNIDGKGKTIGDLMANRGSYGFKLPENKRGYEVMFVDMNKVVVN